MADRIISLRLPAPVDRAVRTSAANAHMSVGDAVDWLLRNSVENAELLRGLADCPRPWNAKLDARIPGETSDQIKLAAERLGISISVYTRRLFYQFFVTKHVFYEKSDGHYTLAVRHD